MRHRRRVDTQPVVAHSEHDVGAGTNADVMARVGIVEIEILGFDGEIAAVGHRLARIYHQVHDDLLDLARIRLHAAALRIEEDTQVHVLADQPPQHLVHLGDNFVEIEHLRLQHLIAAEGQ
jgi:hypothetical protein